MMESDNTAEKSCEACAHEKHGHVEGHGHHELTLRGVGASYAATRALAEVNFSVFCGKRLALLGPNGAGKSTLIRILCGLMKADVGEVLWRGKPLQKATREIAYLPQIDKHLEQFPASVAEVVAMGRYPHVGIWRKFRAKDQEKVEEALSVMNLDDLRDRQIDELSGGQRQRAFIARALAQEAHVIVLDEPFNGLDVESRSELSRTLEDLAARGHLIICSHHQMGDVVELFDEALVLDTEQVAFGPSAEVMADPRVRKVLRIENL